MLLQVHHKVEEVEKRGIDQEEKRVKIYNNQN
jgi:hypothetical protein